MPTLRRNPLTRDWVLFAPERFERPNALVGESAPAHLEHPCPFCPGNESSTPPEICRFESGDTWDIRVFPNKYAAVAPHDPGAHESGDDTEPSREIPATGTHEVVVECREHAPGMDLFTQSRLERIFRTYADRHSAQLAFPDTRTVVIFKNAGQLAGASLPHPHSQIISLPVIPPRTLRELAAFSEERGACPLCKVTIRSSREDRIVAKNDRFTLLTPFAARHPFEMWIVPRRHVPSFAAAEPEDLAALAELVHVAATALDSSFPGASLNWAIQSSPYENRKPYHYFHWYFELFPRLTMVGGFELATGAFIDIVDPERCAELLRMALADRQTKGTP